MDWSALTAGATAAAAAAALTAAVVTWRVGNRQVRSADTANGVNLAIQIRAHVNSAEFRGARYRAASALLAGEYTSHIVYVLDEMEMVGLLINKGALDQEIIWTMLSALVVNYVAAARSFIDADRQRNPTMWANLLSLDSRMIAVERSQGGADLDATATFRDYLKTELHEMAPMPDAAVTSPAADDAHAPARRRP